MTITNIIHKLCYLANKSNIIHKHAAAVVKNGRIFSTGINSMRKCDSIHAERAALNNYLKLYGIKKYCILWA
jgi:deoxycytidylate deaminase